MGARQYRPESGRFLSQDRYESARGDLELQADPLTQNRYAFAGGNPVSNIEFDGHQAAQAAIDFSIGQAKSLGGIRGSLRGLVGVRPRAIRGGFLGTARRLRPVANLGRRAAKPKPQIVGLTSLLGCVMSPGQCDRRQAKEAANFAAGAAKEGGKDLKRQFNGAVDNVKRCGLGGSMSIECQPQAPDLKGTLDYYFGGSLQQTSGRVGLVALEALAFRRVGGSPARASSSSTAADEIAPKLGSRGGPGTGKRHIPAGVKRQEVELSQGLCRICKSPVEEEAGSPLSREFDHAWPYSRGGDTTLENIQSLCRTCNRKKGPKTTREFLDWLYFRK